MVKYGRGEREVAEALRAHGLEVVPQVRVPHEQGLGHYYDIDLGLFPPAVEIHTDKGHPRGRYNFQQRSTWLTRQGWALACVWLFKGHGHTPEVIEALHDYYQELQDGNPDRYRLYHHDGHLLERGGLEIEYQLVIDSGPWRDRVATVADRRGSLPGTPSQHGFEAPHAPEERHPAEQNGAEAQPSTAGRR